MHTHAQSPILIAQKQSCEDESPPNPKTISCGFGPQRRFPDGSQISLEYPLLERMHCLVLP